MTAQYFTTPNGEEMAVLPRAELEAMVSPLVLDVAELAAAATKIPTAVADTSAGGMRRNRLGNCNMRQPSGLSSRPVR